VTIEQVVALAGERGADVGAVVVGHRPDTVPEAPSHVWICFPSSDGGTVIGGMDRGRFAPYAEFTNLEGAADALVQLTSAPTDAPPAPRPMKALLYATQALADQLRAGLREHAVLPGTVLPEGATVDHIGPESGHCLYLLNTPMGQRSLPPTDLNLDRTGYVVAGPLPPGATVQAVEPWFGQVGGGVMITLPQVIRYYVDTGLLLPFDPLLEGSPVEDA
jgi:hypothetical protein